MNTYILRGRWDSERKAKDLDSLRKWLVGVYKGDMGGYSLDIYIKTKSGKRFLGKFASYNNVPVWYSRVPSIVNDFKRVNPENGKLMD